MIGELWRAVEARLLPVRGLIAEAVMELRPSSSLMPSSCRLLTPSVSKTELLAPILPRAD